MVTKVTCAHCQILAHSFCFLEERLEETSNLVLCMVQRIELDSYPDLSFQDSDNGDRGNQCIDDIKTQDNSLCTNKGDIDGSMILAFYPCSSFRMIRIARETVLSRNIFLNLTEEEKPTPEQSGLRMNVRLSLISNEFSLAFKFDRQKVFRKFENS